MPARERFVAGVFLGSLISALAAGGLGGRITADQHQPPTPEQVNNPELVKLYEEDQADRRPDADQAIDPTALIPRNRKCQARVKVLYEAGELRTGKDYHRAAMVLQQPTRPRITCWRTSSASSPWARGCGTPAGSPPPPRTGS
jgi:hypothetical protein